MSATLECEDKMTKLEMLNAMASKYYDLKKEYYNLLTEMEKANEKDDFDKAKAYSEEATHRWYAANQIEELAKTMFPNVDFYGLFLDTI